MLVPLSQGRFAVVDDTDWPLVCGYEWQASKQKNLWYAIRYYRDAAGVRRMEAMHRLLCGLVRGDRKEVDHADGDGLNNTRVNMRACTHAENAKNRRKNTNSREPYKAVYKNRDRYRARIQVDGRRIHLGQFLTPELAFAAYVEAAKRFHGAFASDGLRS